VGAVRVVGAAFVEAVGIAFPGLAVGVVQDVMEVQPVDVNQFAFAVLHKQGRLLAFNLGGFNVVERVAGSAHEGHEDFLARRTEGAAEIAHPRLADVQVVFNPRRFSVQAALFDLAVAHLDEVLGGNAAQFIGHMEVVVFGGDKDVVGVAELVVFRGHNGLGVVKVGLLGFVLQDGVELPKGNKDLGAAGVFQHDAHFHFFATVFDAIQAEAGDKGESGDDALSVHDFVIPSNHTVSEAPRVVFNRREDAGNVVGSIGAHVVNIGLRPGFREDHRGHADVVLVDGRGKFRQRHGGESAIAVRNLEGHAVVEHELEVIVASGQSGAGVCADNGGPFEVNHETAGGKFGALFTVTNSGIQLVIQGIPISVLHLVLPNYVGMFKLMKCKSS
jgi:hypothetical protein